MSPPNTSNASRTPFAPAATILAFDGVIADTLAIRARSLDDALALAAERFQLPDASPPRDCLRWIPGRTFAEAAREVLLAHLPERATSAHDTLPLETLVDLVAADAGRRYTAALSNGVSLHPRAPELLSGLAASRKVVARADSARRDVDALLALSGLDAAFAFVRCSDDTPRRPHASSIESSWIAIDGRLLAIGIPVGNRSAIESSDSGLDAARPFAGQVDLPRL